MKSRRERHITIDIGTEKGKNDERNDKLLTFHLEEQDVIGSYEEALQAFNMETGEYLGVPVDGQMDTVYESEVRAFCAGCDKFIDRKNSVGCTDDDNDQRRYVARGSCGWRMVGGKIKPKGF